MLRQWRKVQFFSKAFFNRCLPSPTPFAAEPCGLPRKRVQRIEPLYPRFGPRYAPIERRTVRITSQFGRGCFSSSGRMISTAVDFGRSFEWLRSLSANTRASELGGSPAFFSNENPLNRKIRRFPSRGCAPPLTGGQARHRTLPSRKIVRIRCRVPTRWEASDLPY